MGNPPGPNRGGMGGALADVASSLRGRGRLDRCTPARVDWTSEAPRVRPLTHQSSVFLELVGAAWNWCVRDAPYASFLHSVALHERLVIWKTTSRRWSPPGDQTFVVPWRRERSLAQRT